MGWRATEARGGYMGERGEAEIGQKAESALIGLIAEAIWVGLP